MNNRLLAPTILAAALTATACKPPSAEADIPMPRQVHRASNTPSPHALIAEANECAQAAVLIAGRLTNTSIAKAQEVTAATVLACKDDPHLAQCVAHPPIIPNPTPDRITAAETIRDQVCVKILAPLREDLIAATLATRPTPGKSN